jgi:hypothetical protein
MFVMNGWNLVSFTLHFEFLLVHTDHLSNIYGWHAGVISVYKETAFSIHLITHLSWFYSSCGTDLHLGELVHLSHMEAVAGQQ